MDAPLLNRSLWLEAEGEGFAPLPGDVETDVAVVGAGITGVTTALLLKQEGLRVVLLESSRVAHGATGYTTAKLTVGHGTVYRKLVEAHGTEVARAYASSNAAALERVASIVEEHAVDCDFERASNYVYTEDADRVGEVEQEAAAARAAGVDAELTDATDLPYPVRAAVRVDGQAQFHPWKYVAALARIVDGGGSSVHELTRATHVGSGEPCAVETERGIVRARHVVVATQLPFLDRGLFFAKAHPTKSYAVAGHVPADRAPRGMYISVDQPTRSVRSAPGTDGGRMLIVGGEGHKPGTEADTAARYARLVRFLRERFGVEPADYRWSTHDYVPLDGLPYIGRLRRGDDRVYVATGFAKWGMTKGTLAAEIVRDGILGRKHEWADLYDAHRLDVRRSALPFAKENGQVALRFFGDRLRPRDGRAEVERLRPGEGTVARIRGVHYAVHRDHRGDLHAVSARCTHLGCLVGWNAADEAWECPCHGSRFAADGTLVQGPATADLRAKQLPE